MNKISLLLLSTTLLCGNLQAQMFVSSGSSKYVVVEQATGTWAGYCPDGMQDVEQTCKLLPSSSAPRVIAMDWHNGDSMMITGDPFCSGSGFISGFPSATVDRDHDTAYLRPYESYCTSRLGTTPNFRVDMTTTYEPSTRVLNITVTGSALATLTGSWNINAFITEDSISSATGTYQQHTNLTSNNIS